MTDLATEAEQLREIQRLNAHINKLDAEIERLQKATDDLTDHIRSREVMIDRLRRTINNQSAALVHAEKLIFDSGLRLGEAHRVLAHYRNALTEIEKDGGSFSARIAARALQWKGVP